MHVWLVGYCLSENENYIFENNSQQQIQVWQISKLQLVFQCNIINVTYIIILYHKTLYHIILTAHCPNIALLLATLSHDF